MQEKLENYFPVFFLILFYDRGHVTDVFRVFLFLRVSQVLVQVWEVTYGVSLKQLQSKKGPTLIKVS